MFVDRRFITDASLYRARIATTPFTTTATLLRKKTTTMRKSRRFHLSTLLTLITRAVCAVVVAMLAAIRSRVKTALATARSHCKTRNTETYNSSFFVFDCFAFALVIRHATFDVAHGTGVVRRLRAHCWSRRQAVRSTSDWQR